MPTEKETQAYLEALFNFKGSIFSRHFQLVANKLLENMKSDKKKEEVLFRTILDSASRFIIDLFDIIDHSTKDTLKENDIPQFWKLAKKTIENKMDHWLQESVQNSPYLSSQIAKLRSDIREFLDRAAKFHMERQAYTFDIRKRNEKVEV